MWLASLWVQLVHSVVFEVAGLPAAPTGLGSSAHDEIADPKSKSPASEKRLRQWRLSSVMGARDGGGLWCCCVDAESRYFLRGS